MVHQDEIEDLRNTIGRAKEIPGGTAEFAFRVRHGDGTWRWLEGIATNLLDDPAVQGVVINARDVTERRARLERQEALAELGRDVLRETSLKAVIASATSVIKRMVHARDCRIVRVFDGGDAEEQPSGSATGMEADDRGSAAGDCPASLRVPVGDPERPLAHIEVYTDGPPTR